MLNIEEASSPENPGRDTFRLKQPIDVQDTNDIVADARRDSDLEKSSRNFTEGSFSRMLIQPKTYTKCPNLRFISY